jgi:hypothetical protein
MIEISHTKMNDLLCGFRFQALYDRLLQELDDDDSLMGIIGHAAAAKYGMRLWKIKQFSNLPLYSLIINAEIKRHKQLIYSPSMPEQIIKVGENFASRWTLDKDAEDHFFEKRLAVDRNYKPCEITDACDKIAGTPDHVALYRHRTKAKVTDYKMGFRMFDYDFAQHSDQLLLYAWLLWKNIPTLEEITVWMLAPMFNQSSQAAFKIELLPALVEPRIEAAWAKIEELQATWGKNDWPAEPNWLACKWCKLACPKYQQYLEALNGKSA